MKRLYLIAASLTGLLALNPLKAEDPPTEKQLDELRKAVRDFSICTVKRRHSGAKKAILQNVDNGELLKKFPDLLTPDCISGSEGMRFPGDQIKYGIAGALVELEFKSAFPKDLADRAALSHRKANFDENAFRKSRQYRKEGEEGLIRNARRAEAFLFLSEFGECVVRSDVGAVHQFLTSPVAGTAEKAALARVRPLLGPCVPVGQEIELNLMTIRGTLAMNFYRLAYAPPKTSQAAGVAR